MARLMIWRSNLESARERATLTPVEMAVVDGVIADHQGNIPVEVEHLPLAYARALLEDPKLKPNQRAVLALHAHGMKAEDLNLESIYGMRVRSALEFGTTFGTLSRKAPNAELLWNGRWYPVIALAELQEDEHKLAKHVMVRVTLVMGNVTHDVNRWLDPAVFTNEQDQPTEHSVLDVLQRLGFRRLQTQPAAFNVRLLNAERLAQAHGTLVWVKGAVLQLRQRFFFGTGLSETALGTLEVPRRAVVEPTLEAEDGRSGYGGFGRLAFGESTSRVPLVRVFSLDTKSYVFADIDDLDLYEFDDEALGKLFLPPDMQSVLRRVFETPTEELFGDLVRGKHGGVVILASGSPGVGKTLTAEVYAEMSRRPLYVLEFGEMGTTVEQIEANLQRIFARVVRWRAVLQFDECEIFLSHRGEDLERSAIVGIFLRMLDYYEGLLFLTTNRPDVLDDAIRSRVMLRLAYPDLTSASRAGIWRTMFAAAGLTLTAGTFDDLGTHDMNGRQIRNLVRLARILHPDRAVTDEQIAALLRFGCK